MLIFLGHWFLLRNYKTFGVCENADGLDRTCRVQMANALSQNMNSWVYQGSVNTPLVYLDV